MGAPLTVAERTARLLEKMNAADKYMFDVMICWNGRLLRIGDERV